MASLRDQIGAARLSIEEKNEEASTLNASVKRFEHEAEEIKEFFEKKLKEEREKRLDEDRRFSTTLLAKEREVNRLNDDLKTAITDMKKVDQEMLASNILTQRIVDLEAELNHYQTKYHKSISALTEMEEALLTVVDQRKKFVQTKASPSPEYSD